MSILNFLSPKKANKFSAGPDVTLKDNQGAESSATINVDILSAQ